MWVPIWLGFFVNLAQSFVDHPLILSRLGSAFSVFCCRTVAFSDYLLILVFRILWFTHLHLLSRVKRFKVDFLSHLCMRRRSKLLRASAFLSSFIDHFLKSGLLFRRLCGKGTTNLASILLHSDDMILMTIIRVYFLVCATLVLRDGRLVLQIKGTHRLNCLLILFVLPGHLWRELLLI